MVIGVAVGIALILVAIVFAIRRERQRKVKLTKDLEPRATAQRRVRTRYSQPTSSLKEMEATNGPLELPGNVRDLTHELMNSSRG